MDEVAYRHVLALLLRLPADDTGLPGDGTQTSLVARVDDRLDRCGDRSAVQFAEFGDGRVPILGAYCA
jgi:hypothetical protein